MDKYEYLTGEDLGYKPGVLEKAKFDYSPLGEALSKELKKNDERTKVVKYNNDLVIILIWTLINLVCLILMKYHQFTLNLMH